MTFLGMPGSGNLRGDESFPEAARRALRDTQMRRNVGHATHTIRTKRLGAVSECPDWEELREAGGAIKDDPLTAKIAAISCGIHNGTPVLDLDYVEDSNADADANFVLIEGGKIAEAQATAEGAPYDEEAFLRLLRLGQMGCAQIFKAQDEATRK